MRSSKREIWVYTFYLEKEQAMRVKCLRRYVAIKQDDLDSKQAREAYYKAIAWQKELEEQELDSMIETLKSIPTKAKDS